MARRLRYDEQNLTPLRAVDLLVTVYKARESNDGPTRNRAFDAVGEALQKHVRFGLRRRRR